MAKVIAAVDAFQRRDIMVALYTHFRIGTKTVFYIKFTISFHMYTLKTRFAEKVLAVTTLTDATVSPRYTHNCILKLLQQTVSVVSRSGPIMFHCKACKTIRLIFTRHWVDTMVALPR